MRPAVAAARRQARRQGLVLAVAGGGVRDLLLGLPLRDLDLLVDRDALGFSESLAAALSAGVQLQPRFQTATLTLPGGSRLDVAAARRETYARPGALPDVQVPSSIAEDLARRDFTINAMALEIVPRRRLLDPHGGRADLAMRKIRFIDDRAASPRDDPTRAFRAVRYANRLRFRIAPAARRAIAGAVASGAVDAVSGDRLRRELALILNEPRRGQALRALADLGLLAAVSPALPAAGAASRAAAAEVSAARVSGTTWFCYFLAWMGETRASSLGPIADRLAFAGRDRRALLAWPETRSRLSAGLSALSPSARAREVQGLSPDEGAAAAALLPARERRALLEALSSVDRLRLSIAGSDLLQAGAAPGPAIGRALAETLAARQDGRIARADELAFALERARERGSPTR